MTDPPFASIQTARYIPAFLAVARYGSFTKAAQALGISQPAVTMAVHQLEQILGVKLFERTTRHVALTQYGTHFVPAAERLVANLDVALKHLADDALQSNQLRITAVHSVAQHILPRSIATFLAASPEVQIMLHEGTSRGVWRRVKTNEADFGFATPTGDEPDVLCTPLFQDRLGVLARSDHELFQTAEYPTWADLERFDFIRVVGDVPAAIIHQLPDLPANIRQPRYEISYSTVLGAMLHEGNRVSVVPALFAPERTLGGLIFRPLEGPIAWRRIATVTHRHRAPSSAAGAIIALVGEATAAIAATNPLIEML